MADNDTNAPPSLDKPQVRLVGRIDEALVRSLEDQLGSVEDGSDPVVVELTTLGGDAEMGHRAMLAIEQARERLQPRRLAFLGKTVVYSAGITLMSGFPREDRFLHKDAMLLIHSRQMSQSLNLNGPLRTCLPQLHAKIHELETGIRLEEGAFEKLIAGSSVRMDALLEKALHNWYVSAEEAVELGLVAGLA